MLYFKRGIYKDRKEKTKKNAVISLFKRKLVPMKPTSLSVPINLYQLHPEAFRTNTYGNQQRHKKVTADKIKWWGKKAPDE